MKVKAVANATITLKFRVTAEAAGVDKASVYSGVIADDLSDAAAAVADAVHEALRDAGLDTTVWVEGAVVAGDVVTTAEE